MAWHSLQATIVATSHLICSFAIASIHAAVFSEPAFAIDLNDQASIVEAAAMERTPGDVSMAEALASDAAERADRDLERFGKIDWGP